MRYKITLSYDGTPFSGWQIQPNAPSIQESLQRVLGILLKEETDHYRVSIRSKKGWSAQRVAAERFHGGGRQ